MASDNMSELLDELFELTQCQYISDLHDPRHFPRVAAALRCVDAERYSADVWSAAASYISGTEPWEGTPAELKERLLSRLTETNT